MIRDLKENRPVIRDWDPPFTTLMSRISWLSQKHTNFVRFSYFSCIPFVSLSFLPLVYKTSIYKLSFQLHLKAIIEIFRSGFLDFLLAIPGGGGTTPKGMVFQPFWS